VGRVMTGLLEAKRYLLGPRWAPGQAVRRMMVAKRCLEGVWAG
jgi:hypothetical protein